jgi:hypothetical protein
LLDAEKAIEEVVKAIQTVATAMEEAEPSKDNGPFAKFTLFPKLPIELRLMIWQAAFPRVQPFNLNVLDNYRESSHWLDGKMHIKEWNTQHNTPLPITLQVSQESRVETLKHYTIFFPRDIEILKHSGMVNRPLCLNPDKDHVFINVRLIFILFPCFLLRKSERSPGAVLGTSMVLCPCVLGAWVFRSWLLL